MSDLPGPRLASGDSKGGGGEKIRVRGEGRGAATGEKATCPSTLSPALRLDSSREGPSQAEVFSGMSNRTESSEADIPDP